MSSARRGFRGARGSRARWRTREPRVPRTGLAAPPSLLGGPHDFALLPLHPERFLAALRMTGLTGLAVVALACQAAAISPPPPPSKTTPQPASPKTATKAASKSKAAEPDKALSWAASLSDGLAAAKKTGQPILVRVWGQSCPWCKKLDAEIAKLPLQRELARWTLVAVDAGKSHDDVRQLGVGPIPALRVLTARGRAVAFARRLSAGR